MGGINSTQERGLLVGVAERGAKTIITVESRFFPRDTVCNQFNLQHVGYLLWLLLQRVPLLQSTGSQPQSYKTD